MIRVALIGAPRAGKTDTAHALIDKFVVKQERTHAAHIALVDDYAENLSKKVNVAYGHFAAFLGNMQIAYKRLEEEQAIVADEEDLPDLTITCGTVIETMVYAGLRGLAAREMSEGLEQSIEIQRGEDTAHALVMLLHDTWQYDHVFYLPYEGEYDPTTSDAILDGSIIKALDLFSVAHVSVTGTPEEKADKIYEYVKRDLTPQASDTDGS